jgi:hypothetical protein
VPAVSDGARAASEPPLLLSMVASGVSAAALSSIIHPCVAPCEEHSGLGLDPRCFTRSVLTPEAGFSGRGIPQPWLHGSETSQETTLHSHGVIRR